jgi:5-methylcytosine-specific restriction protein A
MVLFVPNPIKNSKNLIGFMAVTKPYIPFQSDPKHVAKERNKAKEMRQSQWWKQKLALGMCYYCGQKFSKEELSMDHITPIARGGKTSKGNVVTSCKPCNSKKRALTPAEMILEGLKK